MAFNQREICTLTVNGREFGDWKSITVYLCQKEAFNYYRFTVSERVTASPPKVMSEIQIVPGMQCTVTLGGEYAIGGFVTTRQVAYTENAHGVEITGKSYTFATVNGGASVKGGEMTNVTYTELATKVVEPFGLTFSPKGVLSQEKFERVNVTGQTAWEVLEKHARQRDVILGVNPFEGSNFWGTQKGFTEGHGVVEEGVNILEGRETISMEFGSGPSLTLAQHPPSPQQWGHSVTSAPLGNLASSFASGLGVGKGMFMPLISMAEAPGKQGDASQRSGAENTAISGEQIKVEVVLQGWFTAQGRLWRPWMKVHVRSPSLVMDQALICKSVTFTQDDRSGTRTTLELWNEQGQAKPTL
jgi:prophage tail gpP-like protein